MLATPAAASIADLLLNLVLGPTDPATGDRLSLEGLSFGENQQGALELGIRKMEVAGLQGSLTVPSQFGAVVPSAAGAWSLGPLAAANGTIHAQIRDAHLVFDADVTVPIVAGEIRFNDARVAHVGPDSRMGVSRLGLYVDAPNGRSYLYQFASVPVAGAEFERRGALGARVSDRGKLRLQEFGEGLLRQGQPATGPGFTEQARLLFARTSLSGEVRLGDGRFAAPGLQADLVGRGDGRNVVRLKSESVGRGISAAIDALAVRNAVLTSGDRQVHCDEITGALTLRLAIEAGQVHVALAIASLKLSGLVLRC